MLKTVIISMCLALSTQAMEGAVKIECGTAGSGLQMTTIISKGNGEDQEAIAKMRVVYENGEEVNMTADLDEDQVEALMMTGDTLALLGKTSKSIGEGGTITQAGLFVLEKAEVPDSRQAKLAIQGNVYQLDCKLSIGN